MARTLKRKILFTLIMIGMMWLFSESILRIHVSIKYKVPYFQPHQLLYRFYPPEWDLVKNPPERPENEIRILLLGGSVLNMNNGRIEAEMYDQWLPKLEAKGKSLRIYNASTPGHTSLDSKIKLEFLTFLEPDLTIVLHGINETRFNNCPPEIFREDYGHIAFYEKVHNARDHFELNFSVIPWLVEELIIQTRQKHGSENYIPKYGIPEGWEDFGSSIHTAKSFRNNYEDIYNTCRNENLNLLFLTFPFYIPKDYTRERWAANRLDYNNCSDRARFPIELWGKKENVQLGMERHNEILRDLGKSRDVHFVDTDKMISGVPLYFDDVCHLSDEGSKAFVEAISEAVEGILLGP